PVGVPPDPVTVAVNVTACPTFDGFRLDATVVDVVAFTVCVRTEDVPPVYVVSPPYTAVMLCGPAASVDAEWVPLLAPFSLPVPSVNVPSLNVTVPVGVPPVLVTVAVNVTDWPTFEGFVLEATAVVVVARLTVCATAPLLAL